MRELMFATRVIGDQHPCYIVLEAGPTHYGLESALALVDAAAASGADAIKFQIGDAKRLIPDPDVMFTYTYLVDKHTGETAVCTESLQEILLRRQLTTEEWRTVAARCREKGITFFATAFNVEDFELFQDIGVDCVKICSGDISYHHILREAAKYPWVVQIDTGSATIGEVADAVEVLEQAGTSRIIINHCPSGYPANLESVHLRVLTSLRTLFPYPVAFSDHNPGSTMDIAAVALGCNMLEKTITLDRTIRSPEHIMSLEPDEIVNFIHTIRDVETALGSPRRLKTPEERKAFPTGRRSLTARMDIPAGTVLTQEHLDYARPGDGLPPSLDTLLIGRRTVHAKARGERFTLADIS